MRTDDGHAREGLLLSRAGYEPWASATNLQTECVMDWNRIEGNWKQFKGQAKEKWGRLTDDDLDVVNGRQEQLQGKIQERYGLAKDQAKKDVDAWFKSLPCTEAVLRPCTRKVGRLLLTLRNTDENKLLICAPINQASP
jgi:uncharacterized protein YjbJ (UPF0337 family)